MNFKIPLRLLLLFTISCITYAAELHTFTSVNLPLRDIFDNQAASSDGSADFDGHGSSFDAQLLPSGPLFYDTVQYDTPTTWGAGNDNVIANGQVVNLDQPTYVHELHFLYAGDSNGNEFVNNLILTFTDNSTQAVQRGLFIAFPDSVDMKDVAYVVFAKNWWIWAQVTKGVIEMPYHFERQNGVLTKNPNTTQIHQWSTAVSSESKLQSITFPQSKPSPRLHFFAISYTPSFSPVTSQNEVGNTNITVQKPESQAILSVRRVRFTTKWESVSDNQRAQVVEVTLANILPTRSLSPATALSSKHTISISGGNIRTVQPGVIYRLVPGDQARVQVLIQGATDDGSQATVEVRNNGGKIVGSADGWAISPLIEEWTADSQVLSLHEAPTWWKKAKYGIFIHWGVYSVPAWAPPDAYAEWYDWGMHNPPNTNSPTWNHHLTTYGPSVVYDDFIANFTASKFNASTWLDLFDKAGARYFVFVTKHHDGFALFDTGNTTHRSSVHLGPKRDFLQELMVTAKQEKPHIHRGTYYSLPEWFNPDYAKYGFAIWPGGLAHNAFNDSEVEPYTGRLEIQDYLRDLQLPHMLDIAKKYDTEIMWCDIGGPNLTPEFAAQFYNHASSQDRQVTINNRCGAVPDFDTPEYATFGAIQTRDWESNEGMDPFSYGLNSATSPEQYMNASTIIQTLVDIVSKNGNFLLDVGPNAEGEIITPMAEQLLDAGEWLSYSGDCVFDTNYWFESSQDMMKNVNEGAPPRFTTTPTTFCIIAYDRPSEELTIQKRLPLLPGDKISLLHPDPTKNQTMLKWKMGDGGQTTIQIPTELTEGVQNAWAFRVEYNIV